MAELKINGLARIMNGVTSLRTLLELNTLATTLNTNLTNLINLSTSEKVIGKWIDGSIIYSKTIKKNINTNELVSIPYNVSNAKLMWFDLDNSFYYANAIDHYFPILFTTESNYISTYIRKKQQDVAFKTSAWVSSGSYVVITLKYTK